MCDRIAEGDSVQDAAAKAGISFRSFYNALARADEEPEAAKLVQSYARARRCRADARAERIDEIIRRTMLARDDEEYLEPNAARVVIDAIKWQAAKENNGRYGDRITIEDDGPKKSLNREEALSQLAASGLTAADVFGVLTKPAEPVLEIESAKPVEKTQASAAPDFVDIDD